MFIIMAASLPACTPKPRDVVTERFPECFAGPMIGAGSGVRCEHDAARDEWHITFWNGWGDCPAGCINKEDTAWYLVDKDGRVFKTDKNFNPLSEIKPDQNLEGKSNKIDIQPERPGGQFFGEPQAGASGTGGGRR
ncbi:MAG TPA: hypothetical protein VM658_07495 [bacterium]|nr:hypothetical protein [bacterium]